MSRQEGIARSQKENNENNIHKAKEGDNDGKT